MSKMLQKLLAVGLALAFLLSMPGVSAIVEAASSAALTNMTGEEFAKLIADKNGNVTLAEGETYCITSAVAIQSDVTITGGKFTRPDNSDSIFDVYPGANLTLKNVKFEGHETKIRTNSPAPVGVYGNLVMTDCEISGFCSSTGGGLRIFPDGNVEMNGGKISSNICAGSSRDIGSAASYGGGVLIQGGSFTLKNGEISNNTAGMVNRAGEGYNAQEGFGGGIYVTQSGTFTMEGNSAILNNTCYSSATAKGGGLYIGGAETKVNLKSGIISGNKSINKDAYTNRETGSIGGGIYVHNYASLNLKNVAVYNNEAGSGSGNGGNIWFCDNGKGLFYATTGAFISAGVADRNADDFYSTAADNYPPYYMSDKDSLHLSTRLYDGTPITWYIDSSGHRYKDGERISHNDDLDTWLNDNLEKNISLHSETTGSKDDEYYKLIITGNYAGEGAGIACNGTLIMGENTDTSLMVKKVWQDSKGNPLADIPVSEITVNLVNNSIKDEENHGKVVDTVTLNAGNDWHYTFKDLPSDQEFTVEEVAFEGSEDYEITTVTAPQEGEGETADKTITVTNKQIAKTGDLRIVKTVKGRDGDKKKYFRFDIVITDAEGKPIPDGVYGGCEIKGGEYTADIPHGNALTITGLPDGAKYTITEHAYDGYRTTVSDVVTSEKTGTIVAGETQRVEFVNTRTTGNLSVKKVVSAKDLDKVKSKAFNFTVKLDTPLTGTYGDMTFTDGEARFTLTHEETKTATGLPTGIKYTVTEEHSEGYITSYTSMTGEADENGGWTGEIAEGVAKVTVTNIKNVGDLTVTKVVDGSGDLSKEFNFIVTLSGTAESGEKGEEINGQYGDMAFSGGVAQFELKSGESKSANNLPIGLEYTVTEAEADKDDYKTSYAVTEKVVDEGEPSLGTESTHSGNSGKIGRDSNGRKCQVVVKVTNTRPYGSLSIKKAIEGAKEGAYEGHVFKFKVTGPSVTTEEPLEVIGSGVHTLSHLIPGEYTIEEVSDSAQLKNYDWNGVKFTDANGKEITKEGNTIKVTVKANENTATEVVANNSYTSKLGSLKITKKLANGAPEEAKAKEYTFKVTGPSYPQSTYPDGYEVTVIAGAYTILEDLTPGKYTVEEVGGDIEGYTKTVDVSGDGAVTVEANKTAEVTVTNAYTQIPGSLKIVKTAKYSDGAPVPERTFRFTVTGPSYPNGTTVDVAVDEKGHGESEVLDNLIPGEYTVTEDAENAKMDGYELDTTVGGVTGFSKTVTVDYTSETKPVEVEAVNTYTQILGSLKIAKEAKDTEGKPVGGAHTFAFTVTGPSYPDGHEVTVTVDENGHGESEVLKNLIPGEYTVAEVPESAKLDGYYDPQVEYVSSATVNVKADKTATASVTVINTYEKQYGKLYINKSVVIDNVNPDSIPNPELPKTFKVRVTKVGGSYSKDFDVVVGVTCEITGLEPGKYTVSEVTVNGGGIEQQVGENTLHWSLNVSGEEEAIEVLPDKNTEVTATVNITNTYSLIDGWGALEITKNFVIDDSSKLADKEIKFAIEGPNGYNKIESVTVDNFVIRLDYLMPGMYTVSELAQTAAVDGYDWVVVADTVVEVKAMQQAPAVQDIPAEVPAVVTIPIPEAPEMIATDMIVNPAMNAPEGFGMNVFGEVPEDQPELFPEEIPEMFVTDMPAPFAPLDDNTVGDPVPADQVVTNTEPARLTVTNTYNKLGSLVLTKNVTGTYTGAYGKTYSFTVTGPSYPNGTTVYVVVDEDGHGETQLDNLKPGTYTVDENDKENLEQKGFVFNVTGEGTAAVEYGETAGITVTNDYKELGKLTVTKSVKGLPEDLLGTEEFNFEVRNEAGEAVAEFTLKNGESYTVEGLEPGTYTVTEKDAKVEGYDVTVTGEGTAEVKYDATALVTVTNTYEELGKLTVTKKVEGLDGVTDENILNHEYSFEVRNEKGETVDAFTLKDGKSYTVENLKPGTYEIIETNNELDGYKLDVKTDGSAEVEYGKTANVTVTNSYKELGKLTVTKSVAGDSEEAKSKLYTFKIEGPDGFVRYVTVTGNGSVTVDKLEPGTYTVTEVTETYTDENGEEVSVNLNIDGYTWDVTGQGQEVVIDLDDADKAEGEVTVTNTYTRELGSLTITKSVEGNSDEAEDKVYTFNVTGPDGYSASVTVTGSGSTTLTDLVPGTYTVTEGDAEIEGFELEVTGGGTVEVVANETAGITVTNTYTKEVGSLTITKTVAGDSDEAEGKTYTFDVSGPDGYAETVNITGNGSATLEDLVPGVYTVTERNSEIDGYELAVTGGGTVSAVVVKDETATAAFTNTYRELRSISVTKEWYVDGNRAFAPAGASITVNLLANGADTGKSLVISESTGWAGTFEELYVNDENGEPIAYSISEQSYLGWQSSVTGSADSGFVVINSTTTPPDTPDIPNIPDNPYYPTIPEYPTPEEPYIPPVDIPEPEVPLTDIPDEPEVPLTDIVDDEVPLFDKVPETGDESNTALWISIAACSALGIAILAAALIRDSKKTGKED